MSERSEISALIVALFRYGKSREQVAMVLDVSLPVVDMALRAAVRR